MMGANHDDSCLVFTVLLTAVCCFNIVLLFLVVRSHGFVMTLFVVLARGSALGCESEFLATTLFVFSRARLRIGTCESVSGDEPLRCSRAGCASGHVPGFS